jgi:hypothetical protein
MVDRLLPEQAHDDSPFVASVHQRQRSARNPAPSCDPRLSDGMDLLGPCWVGWESYAGGRSAPLLLSVPPLSYPPKPSSTLGISPNLRPKTPNAPSNLIDIRVSLGTKTERSPPRPEIVAQSQANPVGMRSIVCPVLWSMYLKPITFLVEVFFPVPISRTVLPTGFEQSISSSPPHNVTRPLKPT